MSVEPVETECEVVVPPPTASLALWAAPTLKALFVVSACPSVWPLPTLIALPDPWLTPSDCPPPHEPESVPDQPS